MQLTPNSLVAVSRSVAGRLPETRAPWIKSIRRMLLEALELMPHLPRGYR
jgi:hypothetical protein